MSLQATEILARMSAAYAACSSYRDEGVVTTTFLGPQKRTQKRPFSTRIVRPDGFLFEFRDRAGEEEWNQYVVWLENGRTRTWWTITPDRDQVESLGRGLAGATGVSGGSAHRVPHLLMPELSASRAGQEPTPASVIDVPEAAAQNCVVIELPELLGHVEQIWIDASSFLIRRVVVPRHDLGLRAYPSSAIQQIRASLPKHAAEIEKVLGQLSARGPTEVESVTTYDAAFNVEIDPAELVFVPPAGKR